MLVDVHASQIGDETLVAELLHVEDQDTLDLLMLATVALGPRNSPSSSGMLKRGRLLTASSSVGDRS